MANMPTNLPFDVKKLKTQVAGILSGASIISLLAQTFGITWTYDEDDEQITATVNYMMPVERAGGVTVPDGYRALQLDELYLPGDAELVLLGDSEMLIL